VPLDRDAAFRKIVDYTGGGSCYEMNGLFGSVLESLGFDVRSRAGDTDTKEGGWWLPKRPIFDPRCRTSLVRKQPERGMVVLAIVSRQMLERIELHHDRRLNPRQTPQG
jgi:arylamine N-acetyltransferase